MKLTNILKLTAIAAFSITASCGDKHDDHAGHDHAGHDHAEGEHDEHAGHDHAKGEHDKDEHAEHDHSNPDHDHSKCGVVVGPKGGRMIEDMAELNLTDDGKLTLDFVKAPSADTKVTLLINSEPLELTKEGNTYTSTKVNNLLPAEVHVSIKSADDKHVEKFKVETGECPDCKNAKLACTCHNHDHGDHKEGHNHDDHKGHDH